MMKYLWPRANPGGGSEGAKVIGRQDMPRSGLQGRARGFPRGKQSGRRVFPRGSLIRVVFFFPRWMHLVSAPLGCAVAVGPSVCHGLAIPGRFILPASVGRPMNGPTSHWTPEKGARIYILPRPIAPILSPVPGRRVVPSGAPETRAWWLPPPRGLSEPPFFTPFFQHADSGVVPPFIRRTGGLAS